MDRPVALPAAPATSVRGHASPLLRFMTYGSVDDGKSTLIGRLLYDSGSIPDDQLARLSADSRRWGTQGASVDYALLLDGLSAEREQGITIDVAYRYFSTPRRAFIVADTPGHRQYTRNMATGASTADLAILLVDARKGIVTQTRRHSLIVSMPGVRHLVLAVNKMDLVGFDQGSFQRIAEDFGTFAARLGFTSIVGIPIAAKQGENVVHAATSMPWYKGVTLLDHLEQVDVVEAAASLPLRLPVQLVSRPTPDFRGYAGTIAAGTLHVGMAVRVLPAGNLVNVVQIVTADGDLQEAVCGRSVTVVLDEEVDVSRGDMIVDATQPPVVADTLDASLLWVADQPLDPDRAYLLKAGNATTSARIEAPRQGIDVETGALVVMTTVSKNEIGKIRVRLDRKLPFDSYARSRGTGGFILIDRLNNETVAVGLVERTIVAVDADASAAIPLERWPTLTGESPWRSLAKAFCWRALGSFGTIVLAFSLTHDRKLAAIIGGGEVLTKVFIFFLHERVWARVAFGLDRSRRAKTTSSL
jgi:sulfate adenylyltransferase large subunit